VSAHGLRHAAHGIVRQIASQQYRRAAADSLRCDRQTIGNTKDARATSHVTVIRGDAQWARTAGRASSVLEPSTCVEVPRGGCYHGLSPDVDTRTMAQDEMAASPVRSLSAYRNDAQPGTPVGFALP